ncbi:MAG: N-formylglutamate amidohydrolase [Desulfobulbales bacterium]
MKLPLFISIPHAGTHIPPEVRDLCILQQHDILADYDAEAEVIYTALEEQVAGCCTTDIARSLIDLNRAPDHLGGDGVIKSHTSWNIPVYRQFPDDNLIRVLLEKYYFPYHEKLSLANSNRFVRLGIDCHTMSALGPPAAPDPGRERPLVCLSYGDGTCPEEWIKRLASYFSASFNDKVSINSPFRGGYIIRKHASELYWVQIEISQTMAYSVEFKKNCLLEGLQHFCHTMF